jgi:hypothetical protein
LRGECPQLAVVFDADLPVVPAHINAADMVGESIEHVDLRALWS